LFAPLRPEDPTQVSGYRLRARLGAGGMGQVYLSSTPGGRPVALKLIRPDYAEDAEFRRRFAQEVQAAQRVNGVYTAQLLDADPDATTPWLASAYVAGPSLAEAVHDHGPLPLDTVRPLLAAVALSLEAIHSSGVVHRDLKPHNIVLAADGPRVIDFGIARAFDATYIPVSATPIGTPAFMSPEQANEEQVGPASDVFALGAVAHFAATGRTAFGEGQVLTVLRRVADANADLTGCPPQLRPLVEACLAKDPARRPTTADVVAACGGVPRFTHGWLPAPVTAGIEARTRQLAGLLNSPVPPASVVTAGGGRRRRFAVAAAGLVVAGIVAGAAITSALRDGSSGDGPGTGPQVQGTSSRSTTTKGADPSASMASGSPTPSVTTQWTGAVRVAEYGIDLDVVPPKVADSTDLDIDVRLDLIHDGDYMDIRADGSNLARWTGSAPPDAKQCADLVSTQGAASVRLQGKGDEVVCVKTDQGRMASLAVKGLAVTFGQGFTATATVWPLPG
jgi:hypothetical protein